MKRTLDAMVASMLANGNIDNEKAVEHYKAQLKDFFEDLTREVDDPEITLREYVLSLRSKIRGL